MLLFCHWTRGLMFRQRIGFDRPRGSEKAYITRFYDIIVKLRYDLLLPSEGYKPKRVQHEYSYRYRAYTRRIMRRNVAPQLTLGGALWVNVITNHGMLHPGRCRD